MAVKDVLARTGPRKLLALDGGGVRGLLTIQYLAEIEKHLRTEMKRETLVLADYFDYVGGTSTGAILATLVALGKSAAEMNDFYTSCGAEMFEPAGLFQKFHSKYLDNHLRTTLREVIGLRDGADRMLGDDAIRILLLLVLRNATTDSPWPISNNPKARYNERGPNCNLDFPLWQLVRASTAAPTYFPPEGIDVHDRRFLFVDGGVTAFNNPALQLFLMATLEPYRLEWPTGEKEMLLVSVGTGATPSANENLTPTRMNLLYNASSIPGALMHAASVQQDTLCRVLGRARHGDDLDRELGSLRETRSPLEKRLFSYVRYNLELSPSVFDARGLTRWDAVALQRMDEVKNIPALGAVGRAAAAQDVRTEHFADFIG